jgi:Zn-dependent protease
MELSTPQLVAAFALPAVFAITLHEVAHGWVARRLGDRTAEMLGRLTLNPLKHVDLLGTIVVPLALLLMHGPLFGWAKPVPVAARNLRHPHRDMALVAAAGPTANLVMALMWTPVAWLALTAGATRGGLVLPLLYEMGLRGLQVNAWLAAVNLLPILPLDGGRVVNGFLPPRISDKFERLEPIGFLILLILLWQGALSVVLGPIVRALVGLLAGLAGVPFADFQRIAG